MTEVLQLAHLVQHDRVADVDVGRGRIEAELDTQRLACRRAPGELLREFVFDQQFVDAALGNGERMTDFVGDREGGSGIRLGGLGGHAGNVKSRKKRLSHRCAPPRPLTRP